MRKLIASIAGAIFATLSVAGAMAQDEPASLRAQNANVFSAPGGQPLTLPSPASPPAIVADFLRGEGYSDDTVDSLVLERENVVPRTGLTHLRFQQEVGGLTVFGAYVKATVNGDGQLVHLIEALAGPGGGQVRPATVGPRAALDAALAEAHPGVGVTLSEAGRAGNTVTYSGDDFFHRDPTVTRVAIAMQSGALQEGFLVETWSDADNLLHDTLVGGNGRVLGVELRTNNDSYNVFPDHPSVTPQQPVLGPGPGNAESPIGWLSGSQWTVDISGNNAHAYLDRDNNNASDGGGAPVGDGNFLAGANLSADPTTAPNQDVAVQNLFYLNNVIHDTLYRHGFTEGAGNFQENNFDIAGAGSDSVNAEAQDGGGTNNANFATPSDGNNPRMQMYLWTQSDPRRDGDVDSDIIWHEYGHGLTWRMIGSMGGSMSGAIGEGMSDVLAILINEDDVVGEYSYNNPIGIRSAPYAGYPRTYGDFTGQSVHYDGEIYAAIGWRLGDLFQANSLSKDILFDYLVDGMNFTPAGPAFEDMRDGILAAAAGSGHECLIWEAFAAYGVGVGAEGSVKGGGPFGGGKVSVTESFDLPAECGGEPAANQNPTARDDTASTEMNVAVTIDVLANDTDPENDALSVTSANADVGSVAINADDTLAYTPATNWTGTATIDYTVSDGNGGSDSAVVTVTVSSVGDPSNLTIETFVTEGSDQAIAAGASESVTITGTGFATGASVTLENGNGPTPSVAGVIVNADGTTITADVTVKNGGPPRNRVWDVRVTNPDGGTAVCSACLTVTP